MYVKTRESNERTVRWIVIAVLLLGAGVANAATQYWDRSNTTGLQAGAGHWRTSGGGPNGTSWNNSGGTGTRVTWTNGNDAVFSANGTSGVDVNGTVTVGTITFDGTGYTVTGTTLTLVGAGAIVANQDAAISAPIDGTVGLSKSGAGVLTLSGANSYSGTTTVSAGTLRLGASNVVPNASNLTVGGGTFDLQANSDTVATVSLTSGSIIGSGTLTGSVYNVQSGTISAKLGGSGVDLNKTSPGTVIMSGANTYTGTTTISAGTLQLGASNVFADASDIVINGGTLDIGTFSDTVASVTVNEGVITGTTGVLSASSFIIVEENVTIDAILAGVSAPLTKQDAGTTILSKANTYGGETAINAGKLKLNGSGKIHNSSKIKVGGGAEFDVTGVTGGPYVIQNGQVLTGNGTVQGDIEIGNGAILSPGLSPGTMTHSDGDETWAAGGTYEWEINLLAGTQGADPGWDFLNVTDGQLVITATSGSEFIVEVLSLTGANADGILSDWDASVNHVWTIATASGGIVGFDASDFILDDSQFITYNSLAGGSFSIVQSGSNNVNLVFTAFVEPDPVPAPSSAAIGLALGGLGLIRRRRRTA